MVTTVALLTIGSRSTVNITGDERYTPSLLPTERVVMVDDKVEADVVVAVVVGGVGGMKLLLVVVVVVLLLLTFASSKRPVMRGGTQCTVPSY